MEQGLEIENTNKDEVAKNIRLLKNRKRIYARQELAATNKRLKTHGEAAQHEVEVILNGDTDLRPVVIIKNKRCAKPMPVGTKKCEFCGEDKLNRSFYNPSKKSGYLRNVCHRCVAYRKMIADAQK